MPKLLFAAALIAALPMIAAGPALAGSARVAPMKTLPGQVIQAQVIQAQAIRRTPPRVIPPEDYTERIWTHPEGCKYSRTGRPGEIVWFLMRIPKGATCPEFIVQKKIDNAYRAPRIFKG